MDVIDKRTKKVIFIISILLILGIFVGVFQDKFGEITAKVIDQFDDSLFDVSVDIPSSYKEIENGQRLLTSLKLINLGADKRVDVFLDYTIKDSEGKTILTQAETVAVETQANLVRYFSLPNNLNVGDYELFVKLSYQNKEALAKSSFEVVQEKSVIPSYVYWIFGAFLLTLFIIFSTHHVKIIITK